MIANGVGSNMQQAQATSHPDADSARDSFVLQAARTGWIYAVAGEEGLARARSREHDGREVTFLWSDRSETEKWASCIAQNPRIKELPLGEVLAKLLPALHEHNRKVGTDWSDGPDEPEIEPLDIARDLNEAIIEAFIERIVDTGSVYLVGGMYGPAMLAQRDNPNGVILPCWSLPGRAEMRLEGPWEDMVVNEIPLQRFVEATLPGLCETSALVSPDNILGVATREIAPDVLAQRLRLAMAR